MISTSNLDGADGIAYEEWPLFDQTDAWKFFFHLVFQATASTIVSGAIAGRIRLDAYMALTTFMSGVIFSLAVRWTWGGGWLSQLEYPFQDFAGSSVVHLLGGAAAAVTAYILGERKGRFDPKFEAEYDPHSVPQVLSGVLLLWVGWCATLRGVELASSICPCAAMCLCT